MSHRTCSIEDCTNKILARGMCSKHYNRFKRNGSATKLMRYDNPEELFKNKTVPKGDCLIWVGNKTQNGYGQFTLHYKNKRAHRYAWERVNGPVPDGMLIDHICHNKACVNIKHLRLANSSQNSAHLSGARSNKAIDARNVYQTGNSFEVRVRIHGKLGYYGKYSTIEEAKEVASRIRHQLFGKFAGKG